MPRAQDTTETARGRVRVRPARMDDYPAIRRIINHRDNRAGYGFVERAYLEPAVHRSPDGNAKHLFLVAERGGTVVGFVRAYHRNDGRTTVHEIGVAAPQQGCGLGARLMRRVERVARARGQVELGVSTPEGLRSNDFYAKVGFAPAGTRQARRRRLVDHRKPLEPTGVHPARRAA